MDDRTGTDHLSYVILGMLVALLATAVLVIGILVFSGPGDIALNVPPPVRG